ncbi:MAG: FAD-dependent oxidoreductase [Ilumatobacteraceae bacterium]
MAAKDAAVLDVAIIGGGPAGLAAALMLGRSRRSVVIVDAGEPRNAPSAHMHGYLGREGMEPAAFLAAGRAEVEMYGVELLDGRAQSAERDADGSITVTLAGGRVLHARRLLVATGLVDELPAIPGLAERWGRDVLHCPYCHGWEVRDRPIAVIGTSGRGPHSASLFRQLSDQVTLIVHDGPAPTPTERERLHSRNVTIIEETVAEVVVEDDRITGLRLATGAVVPAEAVVVAPQFDARSDLLVGLGIEPVEAPLGAGRAFAPVGPMGATSVAGVYVAGNVADVFANVLQAAAAGAMTGAGINADLVAEDSARAVSAHVWAQDEPPVMDEAFWEERYRTKPLIWSGQPNPQLVNEMGDVPPGRALDVGAGEGADAIWLAERGWTVTAVDISSVALSRGRQEAERLGAGTAERIEWIHADVTGWEPPTAAFDLVTTHYLHGLPGDRDRLYARCAAAVAPGGTLLVVGHHPSDLHAGVGRPQWPELLFTADDIAALLGSQWTVIAADARARTVTGLDDAPATVHDAVLVARRND